MSADIRFYDNELKNWDDDMIQHSPNITFIDVENEVPNDFISNIRITGKQTKKNTQETLNSAYIQFFAANGNGYAQFLQNIIGSKESDKFLNKDYPSNGVLPYASEMVQWAQTNNVGQKCIIFDWDKTITAVEGMYFETHQGNSIRNFDIQTILQFVMGGPDRLAQMIQLFRTLQSMNVKIFIITNNPNASRYVETRALYLELISNIFLISPDLANEILFCAKDHGYKKWKSACAIRILVPFLNCGKSDDTPSVKKTTVTKASKSKTLKMVVHEEDDDEEEEVKPKKASVSRSRRNTALGLFWKLKKSLGLNKKTRRRATKKNKY